MCYRVVFLLDGAKTLFLMKKKKSFNPSPLIQDGMCFGLTNGLWLLLLLFDASSGPSLVKMSLWIQKCPPWEMQKLLLLQLFLHLSPERRRPMPRAGRTPGVCNLPGGTLSHLLSLVGHRSAITGVTSQGERRTRSTPISFSGDRLQGAW